MRRLWVLMAIAAAVGAQAKVVTREVEYVDQGTTLLGYLAYDDAVQGKRPGVLVVHDWNGVDGYEEGRARQLAELGYVAFAADIYGKGVRPATQEESGKQAGIYRSDRALFRRRLNAGLEELRKQPNVDPSHLAAIGYCFGGGGVLELARSGAELQGAVSFHGNLDTPNPADANAIRAKMLVINAIDDPAVPRNSLLGFFEEMKAAKKDYQVVLYNLQTHAFTVPGPMYNADADRRSWQSMKDFFAEIFGQR